MILCISSVLVRRDGKRGGNKVERRETSPEGRWGKVRLCFLWRAVVYSRQPLAAVAVR